MIHKGIATFTLDYGACPKWLFERMVKLGRHITYAIVEEYGPEEFVRRVSDPVWFQSLGTVLAFDWNASGLTTILTAALKEAIRGNEHHFGFYICGGKGKTSRKTPDQIVEIGERINLGETITKSLVYNSKMAAKVDSSLVQDGFQLYHHAIFFAPKHPRGGIRNMNLITPGVDTNIVWSVVQQGMNQINQTARRYHWYSNNIADIVCEPQSGIATQIKSPTLNLSAKNSSQTRQLSTQFVDAGYNNLIRDITILRRHSSSLSKMIEMKHGDQQLTLLELYDPHFTTHPVINENFSKSKYLKKVLWKLTDEKPKTYEELLATKGVGPKTVRALSLVAEVIYGAKPSYEDPARYSFAHGGKDAIPYPVDRPTYDQTIEFFRKVVQKSRIGFLEKQKIIQCLDK